MVVTSCLFADYLFVCISVFHLIFMFVFLVGMSLLRNTRVFNCHRWFWGAILDGELAMTHHILSAGYNIAAMLPIHQYQEFRGKTGFDYCDTVPYRWTQNPILDPPGGIMINIYDTLFYKYQNKGQNGTQTQATRANCEQRYDVEMRADRSVNTFLFVTLLLSGSELDFGGNLAIKLYEEWSEAGARRRALRRQQDASGKPHYELMSPEEKQVRYGKRTEMREFKRTDLGYKGQDEESEQKDTGEESTERKFERIII